MSGPVDPERPATDPPASVRYTSFALVGGGGIDGLPNLVRAPLESAWIADRTIGFGPPVARATTELVASRGAAPLDRLERHIRVCLCDEVLRQSLAAKARADLVRRHGGGPVEAEALDRSAARAFELGFRLTHPSTAPPGLLARMRRAGLGPDRLASLEPDALGGELRLRLHDPAGTRLLHVEPVAAAAADLAAPIAVELRVQAPVRWVFQRWLVELEREFPGIRVVDLVDPTSHARVRRDGVSR